MDKKQTNPLVVYGGPLFDGINKVYEDGAVYSADGKIIAAGDESKVFKKIDPADNAEIYDTRGMVIFPGLINLHHHFYSALAKGLAPLAPVTNFKECLENLWWRLDKALDPEAIQLSALLSLLDCIQAGVTTVFDHHASPRHVKGSLDNIASVVERSGLRACLCYEISDRDGARIFDQGLQENLSFIEEHRDDSRLRGILGLHANLTLSEKSLSEIGKQYDPEAGIHIHCAEDKVDVDYCRELGYNGPVSRLKHFGLLGKKSILAHGVHLDQEELTEVGQNMAVIVHNPESNANNAVGRLDLPLANDIRVGLGTDGMTSAMLATARAGYLAQRQASIANPLIFDYLPQCLFKTNANVASHFFDCKLGQIVPGAAADIAVFDYQPATPINADNIYGHIIYGMYNTRAAMVMVDGQRVYDDGAFLTLDAQLIREEARKASRRVWEQFVKIH
ncbi:MAG: putative aminohydrolase SsnA [Candidatus Marinimicrobia bacterium]|nr:putative aminohydrolase SsnA [Candidatus Neomarinimicrobiota bacterium]